MLLLLLVLMLLILLVQIVDVVSGRSGRWSVLAVIMSSVRQRSIVVGAWPLPEADYAIASAVGGCSCCCGSIGIGGWRQCGDDGVGHLRCRCSRIVTTGSGLIFMH